MVYDDDDVRQQQIEAESKMGEQHTFELAQTRKDEDELDEGKAA